MPESGPDPSDVLIVEVPATYLVACGLCGFSRAVRSREAAVDEAALHRATPAHRRYWRARERREQRRAS